MFNGLIILVIGMSVVFLFLLLIYVTLILTSALIKKYLPEPVPVTDSQRSATDDILPVISAAVTYYYRNKK